VTGATGATGADGAAGPAGPAAAGFAPVTTTLCVTNKASRRAVRRGGVVGWTIVVKNCGVRSASGVSVTDRLRKGASFKARGGGSLVAGQLRWNAGTLPAGASKTYKITTRMSTSARLGSYLNRATAEGANTRPASGRGSTAVRVAL
jgi:uncharacterized repeat protein (TIGR01451 family)